METATHSLGTHPRKPWLAILLSVVTLGLGHLYVGRPGRAFFLWGCLFLIQIIFSLSVLNDWLPMRFLLPAYVGSAVILYLAGIADAGIQATRAGATYRLRSYNRPAMYVLAFLGIQVVSSLFGALNRSQVIQAMRIPSGAMEPTLLSGDFLFVDKGAYRGSRDPERFDIVVFRYPMNTKKDFIKRVIGLPGETIEIRDRIVNVNGGPLDEPYAVFSDPVILPRARPQAVSPPGAGNKDNYGPIVVPAGHLFVLGDNRDDSDDSRFWGYLDSDLLKGKAKVIYWSWAGQGEVRWDRIGKSLDQPSRTGTTL